MIMHDKQMHEPDSHQFGGNEFDGFSPADFFRPTPCRAEATDFAPKPAIIFDIETEGAADDTLLREFHPAYPEFDPADVKVGDCRDEASRAAKVEAARQRHLVAEDAHWAEKRERRALYPELGRILTIGYLWAHLDEPPVIRHGDERGLLSEFWRQWRNESLFVGWNCAGFDIPYIVRRSWILGLDVPADAFRGRHLSGRVLDLMQVWCCYSFKTFARLDLTGRLLGLGGKVDDGIDGASFAAMFHGTPEQHVKALEYARRDLVLTKAIYLRLVCGRFSSHSVTASPLC